MTTTEQAADIIMMAGRAQDALRQLGLATSTIIHAPSVEVVREVARLEGARLSTLPIRYPHGEREHLMETAHLGGVGSVAVEVLASAPMPLRPVVEVAPDTCSECSGPLDDEALHSGDGSVRCQGCHEREQDAQAALARIAAKKAREAEDGTWRRVLASESRRQQGEGYGPGREE